MAKPRTYGPYEYDPRNPIGIGETPLMRVIQTLAATRWPDLRDPDAVRRHNRLPSHRGPRYGRRQRPTSNNPLER